MIKNENLNEMFVELKEDDMEMINGGGISSIAQNFLVGRLIWTVGRNAWNLQQNAYRAHMSVTI